MSVLLSLVIQHAMRIRHIGICGPLYNIFPHYLINRTAFGGEKDIDHKTRVLIFSTTFG